MTTNDFVNKKNLIDLSHKTWPLLINKLRFGRKLDNSVVMKKIDIAGLDKGEKRPWVSINGNGCIHHLRGGCTMCSYRIRSKKQEIDFDKYLKLFIEGIKYLEKENSGNSKYFFGISTGGSFFDPTEIPQNLRIIIYKEINKATPKNKSAFFSVESRLEFISKEILEESKYYLSDNITLSIGYGLESYDPFIRDVCINKQLPKNWIEKVGLMIEYGVYVRTHVLFKPPFLSEQESICDSWETILNVYSKGLAHEVVLMVAAVFQDTLLDYLHQKNKYKLSSVWSIIKLIEILGPDVCSSVSFNGFAWFSEQKYQNVTNTYPRLVRGCEECSPLIMKDIIDFRAPNSQEHWERLMEKAGTINCRCKKEYIKREKKEKKKMFKNFEKRIYNDLNSLSKDILGRNINSL